MFNPYDFYLPKHLIAQYPLINRTESRLLNCLLPDLQDQYFYNLVDILTENDILVLNNTRVIPSLLHGTINNKTVSINLIRHLEGKKWAILGKPRKRLTYNSIIKFKNDIIGQISEDYEDFNTIIFNSDIVEKLSDIGEMPLPPYIKRIPTINDQTTYQTVYGSIKGAVAAPTAGLHFSHELLKKLIMKGVEILEITLHVSAGTFLPLKDINQTKLYSEFCNISENTANIINNGKKNGKRIIAVGSTTVRTLEGNIIDNKVVPYSGEIDIFIKPGYKFRIVDIIITNFHLPKTSLLMMMAAFTGLDRLDQIYQHAIKNEYRFFSYGDACLLGNSAS